MKNLISNTFGKWFKSCGVAGALRWRIMYWAYKLTGWHIRHDEWDFVLNYLPKLHNYEQHVKVLDVGCSRTLFGYEICRRGYDLTGIDLEHPDEYPGKFRQMDITKNGFLDHYDFVVCISVFEHIGNEGKGNRQDQKKALLNMAGSLKIGGRLLLTCPTVEFAQGHIWHGFTDYDFRKMFIKEEVEVNLVERTERLGQICMAFERVK